MRHPSYRDNKGKLRPCLINDILHAESRQGQRVYTGKVQVLEINSCDQLTVDLLDSRLGLIISAHEPVFNPRKVRIQAGYTHDLFKGGTR